MRMLDKLFEMCYQTKMLQVAIVTGSSDFASTVYRLRNKFKIKMHIIGIKNRIGRDLIDSAEQQNITLIDPIF